MLVEALKFLYSRAGDHAEAKRAHVMDLKLDGRTVLIEHNGELKERTIPPPLRNHVVRSVDDLIAAAKQWPKAPTVWLDEKSVILIIDDADRRETVKLPLVQSNVFSLIRNLKGLMDQPTLVQLLKCELRFAARQAEILTAVRKIKFKQVQQGHGDIQHGNESMGRSIEAEVTGAGDIPEIITVSTNVFSNPGEIEQKFSIGLALEIAVSDQKFRLKPMPDEIEVVIDQALAGIRTRILEGLGVDAAVFFGSP